MTRRVWLGIAAAFAVLLIVVGLQLYLSSSEAEFLAQPIALDDGSEIVAVEVPRTVDAPGSFEVELFLDRESPNPSDPTLYLTPLGIETPGEPRPDLSRRTFSTDGLSSRIVVVEIPAFIADSPGSYTLRVAGRARTFGLVDIRSDA